MINILENYDLIVGLGNPGEKYEKTYHNVGFQFIDFLRENNPETFPTDSLVNNKLGLELTKGNRVNLLKPLLFMNRSGIALQNYIQYFKPKNLRILVAYDSIDHPIGQIQLYEKMKSKSHNGVESILNQSKNLTEEIELIHWLKIGILPEEYAENYKGKFDDLGVGRLSDFVLKKMRKGDLELSENSFESFIHK